MNPFRHRPVLLRETLEQLDLKPGMTVVDCTAGGGGHSRAMLERILPGGFLVAIDQDPEALGAAEANLEDGLRATGFSGGGRKPYAMAHRNFSDIRDILGELGIGCIDAALMDLGVNSRQLDEGGRGFSYRHAGRLDMRMNPAAEGPSAYEVIRDYPEEELDRVFREYGEERWSRRIAQFIVRERERAPIETTDQLVAVIKRAIPAGARADGPHPARRSFMGLRILINRELEILPGAVADTIGFLAPKGRLAVITFHSLEDAQIKAAFRKLAAGCECPKDFPVCVCGKVSQGRILTGKPILPDPTEIEDNPRSRSAQMRVFQKKKAT